MPNGFEQYRVGDTIIAVCTEILCEEVPFAWPVDYDHFRVIGYANWILPRPEDLVTLVGWRLVVVKRLNNGTASTDPREFIKHLMRSTESSSWGSLQTKLGLRSDQLRQYFYLPPEPESEKKEKKKNLIRWMSTNSLKILIMEASLQHRTRRGESTYPTVDIDPRPNCKPLRPTETGAMLRVLDQDEVYARLGAAWRLHIRDRRRLDDHPNFEDLPWLVKKAAAIASTLWGKHTLFEKRCIAKAAYRKALRDWPGYDKKMP